MKRGFSLVELIIVIAIISALGLLSVSSYYRAKHVAAFSVSQATVRQIKTALSLGLVQLLEGGGSINLVEIITNQSQIQNSPTLRELLWGFMLPNRVTLTLQVDSSCDSQSCTLAGVVVDHANACKLIQTIQYGDGSEYSISIPKNSPGC